MDLKKGEMQIIPAILLSELLSSLLAGFFHHKNGNVNFRPTTFNLFILLPKIKTIGYRESFQKAVPTPLEIALLLGTCSIIGAIAAVLIAVNIPNFWLKLYIGSLVLLMGVLILARLKKQFRLSWLKIVFLGAIASFNKGISGGGCSPVVTGGQILSGAEGKNAVDTASLSEEVTCLVGGVTYMTFFQKPCGLENSSMDYTKNCYVSAFGCSNC